MSTPLVKRILGHPDRDDIISKLVGGESPLVVHEWLKSKYTHASETKFALTVESLKQFQDKHLDMYMHLREDILATIHAPKSIDIQLSERINKNKKYKDKLAELTTHEIDIKKIVSSAVQKLELRIDQMYEMMQDDPANFKIDNTLIQWFNTLLTAIEKANKLINDAPDQVVQHNHTVLIADQQTAVIIDCLRELLKGMDYEQSLRFMDLYNEKIGSVKLPEEHRPIATEIRLAEAKLLNEKAGESDPDPEKNNK